MNNRVVFFLGSMGSGGAERVVSIIANDYAVRGWSVDICILLKKEVSYQLNPTINVIDMTGKENASRIKRSPAWIRKIRRYIIETNPATIVSFVARINLLVLLACAGMEKRIIISERNDPQFDGRGFLIRFFCSVLYPHAECIVFQTKRVKSYFSNAIQKKGRIIPNPIDVTVSATNTDVHKLVTVGSLKEQKNHRMLINAFKSVLKVHPEMELYIYGEGYYREETEKIIRNLGLQSKVHLCGNRANVHEAIRDALIFILSSDYEGLSNALLEAMVIGLPCISTRCAGSDEYIIDKQNGLLVDVGDEKGMTKAIISLIEDEKKRKELAVEAKKVINDVGKETALRLWREVIEG